MEPVVTPTDSTTVNDAIIGIRPRAKLMKLLGIERSRLHQIIGKEQPLPAWMLARVAGRYLIPQMGRARTAEMILATLERSYPSAFNGEDVA